MKKIIIINNNMKVGGVQKSLYNLLWSIDTEKQYDVTLLLFHKTGEYIESLPPTVKVVECGGLFRYLGMSQGECKGKDALIRGALAALSRLLGRSAAVRLMLPFQPMWKGEYDCAIAYLHNGRKKSFYGGVQEYALKRIRACRKFAFIHGDYSRCGADYPENNRLLKQFDRIAACSDGCRHVLEKALPDLSAKCMTVRNCHRLDEIRSLADKEPIAYPPGEVHAVLVARLSHVKGIERAIRAVADASLQGLPVKIHIVGDGLLRTELEKQAVCIGVEDRVIFYGEQSNPYRFMKHADLLLLTSYHEAAPMVIDEARALGIPVLTTATTSSAEMVTDPGCGWVCENTQQALNEKLMQILSQKDLLNAMKKRLSEAHTDNDAAIVQFSHLLEM